ncbi:MAG: hypothetical protein WDW36_009247 [Sanguina aurantia]
MSDQVVCRSWKEAALPARRQAFLARWGLLDIVNLPRHASLYETVDLSIIVHSHSLSPGDTLPALALRFQQPLSTVKRINNLLSDASIHHRHCLYIPGGPSAHVRSAGTVLAQLLLACRARWGARVGGVTWGGGWGGGWWRMGCEGRWGLAGWAERWVGGSRAVERWVGGSRAVERWVGGSVSGLVAVAGCTARFEYSPVLCRDLLVLLQDPAAEGAAEGAVQGSGGEALSRAPDLFNRMLLREFRAKVRQQMNGSSAPTDIEAAKFYLHESRGDCAAAARMFVADLGWEGTPGAMAAAAATSAHPTAGLLAVGTPCGCTCNSTDSPGCHHPRQPKPMPKWVAGAIGGLLGCGMCRKGKSKSRKRNQNLVAAGGGATASSIHHPRLGVVVPYHTGQQEAGHQAGTDGRDGGVSFGARVLRVVARGRGEVGADEEKECMLQGAGSGASSCVSCRSAASRAATAASMTILFEDMSLRA